MWRWRGRLLNDVARPPAHLSPDNDAGQKLAGLGVLVHPPVHGGCGEALLRRRKEPRLGSYPCANHHERQGHHLVSKKLRVPSPSAVRQQVLEEDDAGSMTDQTNEAGDDHHSVDQLHGAKKPAPRVDPRWSM